MINAFFARLYASPWGRLARRFAVAGGSSALSWLLAAGKVVPTPDGLVDSLLRLSGGDVTFALKLFVGAGFLAAVDKMRREGVWRWSEPAKPDGSADDEK